MYLPLLSEARVELSAARDGAELLWMERTGSPESASVATIPDARDAVQLLLMERTGSTESASVAIIPDVGDIADIFWELQFNKKLPSVSDARSVAFGALSGLSVLSPQKVSDEARQAAGGNASSQ